MENKPVVHVGSTHNSPFSLRNWLNHRVLLFIVVLALLSLGFLLISKLTDTTKNDSKTEKVLTINDLDNPNIELDGQTSDASVERLTKELKAKIDKQIAAKQNPFETIEQLTGVLANTTNETRQDQLTSFLEDFLAKHESTLGFATESGVPDTAQVNFWKAELYAKLVYNYQFMMQSKFTGSDGKPLDTTKEQLKYINLYLALANDPASHPPIAEKDKDIIVGYLYNEANDFLELKNKLTSEGSRNE